MSHAGNGGDTSFNLFRKYPQYFSRNSNFHLSTLNTYLPSTSFGVTRISFEGLSCLNSIFEKYMDFRRTCNLETLIIAIANDRQSLRELEGGEKSQAIVREIRKLSQSVNNSNSGMEYVTWADFENLIFSTKTNLRRPGQPHLTKQTPRSRFKRGLDLLFADRSEYRRKLELAVGEEYSIPPPESISTASRQSSMRKDQRFISASRSFSSRVPVNSTSTNTNSVLRSQAVQQEAKALISQIQGIDEQASQRTYAQNVPEGLKSDVYYNDHPMDISEEPSEASSMYIADQCAARIDQSRISPEEKSKIDTVIATRTDVEEVLITKFNIPMTRRLLHALAPSKWLNDEVINFYMLLLQQSTDLWVRRVKDHYTSSPNDSPLCIGEQFQRRSYFFSSIFISKLLEQPSYCYANVRRWSRKFDIFSMDKIFCPVNIKDSHWTLAVIHVLDRKVQYYDSMGSSGDRYLKGLLRYLEDEHQDKKKAPLPGGSRDTSDTEQAWRIVHSTTTSMPQQLNGDDCGMFSIMAADYLAYGLPLNFSQDNMPHFRQKVFADILRGELNYPK